MDPVASLAGIFIVGGAAVVLTWYARWKETGKLFFFF